MSTFIRPQYPLIFEAVTQFLTEYKPYYPEGIKPKQELEIWNRWYDKHLGTINEYVDILDIIVHTKYKECQFTEAFVDKYILLYRQLRQGFIHHYEFALQVYSELMGMRTQLTIAALKSKEVQLASWNYD